MGLAGERSLTTKTQCSGEPVLGFYIGFGKGVAMVNTEKGERNQRES